ncbi:flagellar biosynthesis protein FlhB [Neptunicella sp.]|uniref:flagellar biosynthesis protein FlhB n=1 Tax=Neptunicella sp. TaxID=2125986 RepID=UPI003F69055D
MAGAHEKTEEPTAKRKSQARKKGQIARSKEFATTLVLIASAVALLFLGKNIGQALYHVMKRSFTLSRDETYDFNHMFQIMGATISEITVPVLFYMAVVFAAGMYGNIALGGYNFTLQSASPKFGKLNPIRGLKRMFGMNGIVELLKALTKFIVVALTTYMSLRLFQDEALHLDMELYPRNMIHALELLSWVFLIICCSMIPIAIFDVPYQKYKHSKAMKMTKQEVKDERKNSEGNPQVKSRIRKLQYQAAAKRMMQAVPTADVVVTNPTHYSVALKYDQNGNRAPIMIAKGQDELAMHIRTIATAHEVPLVASPMLARAIFYSTEVDHEIPAKLFMAVAQVLAYVYQLKAYKKGKGQRPSPLSRNLPIPPELRR